ncbi:MULTISPECIES: hypothetical protein [Alkalihalophilus]|uniref:Uncharacterized protein n=1 Tax=Alkalihalophilus pseudofirmus (strain ATCC BAA-2126 / JCM 17055 / OF4) TaxID=398511 RepID=D3FUZ8_ALKPO|nr:MULTISPECIES: hypothetical protein [Alkalihalophilus]ADC48424.1 hypothetical protein BpOF4_01785 [Alkalihalophilus pseudofirmus OF4]MEC2073786.1 hypothetical protein [Alkalihalophilus marmarensis]MED1601079.1 hypothetical protein [Alkalihalophilus marmarensis]WEG15916.1 hypothetical protein PQ478_15535 [Alkalihalophilus pseudofirmus]
MKQRPKSSASFNAKPKPSSKAAFGKKTIKKSSTKKSKGCCGRAK